MDTIPEHAFLAVYLHLIPMLSSVTDKQSFLNQWNRENERFFSKRKNVPGRGDLII